MSDYISREAATAYAPLPKEYREYSTSNLDDAFDYGYNFAIEQLESIPAADVRPVAHGEWKHTVGVSYRCSACGKETYMGEGMNFCPNCGADMREES